MMVQCVTCFGQTQMVRKPTAHPIRRAITCLFHSLDIQGWGLSPRGAGFLFGGDVVKQFARANDIDLIARAHQLAMEGYKLMFDKLIVTVWSAPNYCYRCALCLLEFFTRPSRITFHHHMFARNQVRKCRFHSGTGRGSTSGIQNLHSCACSMSASPLFPQ